MYYDVILHISRIGSLVFRNLSMSENNCDPKMGPTANRAPVPKPQSAEMLAYPTFHPLHTVSRRTSLHLTVISVSPLDQVDADDPDRAADVLLKISASYKEEAESGEALLEAVGKRIGDDLDNVSVGNCSPCFLC